MITTRTLEDPTTMIQTSVAMKRGKTASVRRIFTRESAHEGSVEPELDT